VPPLAAVPLSTHWFEMSDAPPFALFDTHAHLDLEPFDENRDAVIRRAEAAGVTSILSVGISAASSQAAIDLAAKHDSIYAAVGIHPVDAVDAAVDDWDTIVRLVDAPKVVAIGETGLDNHWERTPLSVQQDYFDRQIRLAQARGLPLVIHQRKSQAEITEMLREARRRGPLKGIMHSFTAKADDADECLELGMHISFAGMVTFKRSDDLRAVAAGVPADRLLVETDSPFLAPQAVRGKRNEPAYIVHTARCLAEVRGVPLEELAVQTTRNARRLFGLAD